jgi:GNAT superfamily N-acetyltransferase
MLRGTVVNGPMPKRTMITKGLIEAFVKQVLDMIPAKSDKALKQFIADLSPISAGVPEPNDPANKCYIVQDWFYCLRKYEETSLKQNFLEFWIGTGGRHWGYLRLNPYFYDDEGKNRKVWELTHAFAYPQVRGQGINRLYVALALALARANQADLLVANPRHVSMLITLSDNNFKIKGGGGSAVSIKRIIKQGRTWYRSDANARRLYYAEEMRLLMQDGSLMMEKNLAHERFWQFRLR